MSKQKLPRAIGMKRFRKKEFITYDFDGEWRASLGEPERNFRAIVYGASGNGKTDFVVKFARYLATFGKVYYNSFEEGESSTLQKAFARNGMWEMEGKVVLGDREDFDTFLRRMSSRNSPRFGIIDSLDYINLTVDQYKQFVELLPHKSIIMICWAQGKRPKTQTAKDIEYMVDMKIRVHEFKAYPKSRFGGNQPFIIWPEYWEKKAAEAEDAAAGLNYPTKQKSKPKGQKAPLGLPAPQPNLFDEEPPEAEEGDPLTNFLTQSNMTY